MLDREQKGAAMGKKEDSDHLIVVDAERYRRVKKALEESQGTNKAPTGPEEKETTRELVVVDVKRYKKVKKALAESEDRYRHLFENVPIGIYRTTPDGRIVDANPALVHMLGYGSFEELARRNLQHDGFEPGYERSDYIRLLERQGEITGLEAGWTRQDGSVIRVRENAKLIRNEAGEVFFEGTVEDITKDKQAEEAQRLHTRQIEILNDVISRGNLAGSLPELLDVVLDAGVMPLDFDAAAIFLLDAASGTMACLASRGLGDGLAGCAPLMRADPDPLAEVLKGRAVFNDRLADAMPEMARLRGWRMAGCVPFISKGRVAGALIMASSRRDAFSAEEKGLLEMIGKEAGTLISKLQTEAALRESEKYYRTLVETSPDFVFTLGLDGTMTMVNQRFLQLTGFTAGDVVGRNVLELIDDMDPAYFRDGMRSLAESGEIFQFEYPVHRRDGSAFPMEMALSVLTDAAGAPAGIMGVGRDISDRKRAEEAQRVRAQQIEILNGIISKGNLAETLQELLETILDCVVLPLAFDSAGIFMFDEATNSVQLKARRGVPTGFALDEKYMAPDGMPFAMVLGRGEPVFVDEAEKNQPAFFEKWGWRMAGSVPLLSKGRVVGALNVASCLRRAFSPEERETLEMIGKEAGTLISKLQTEAALRKSENYYRILIDTSPDIITVMDLEARLITVNQRFLQVSGYEAGEVIGTCTYDYVAGLDHGQLAGRTEQYVGKRQFSGSEYVFKTKDGQAIPLDVSAGLLHDEAGRPFGIIAIGRDARGRKQAEATLRESEEKFRSIAEQTSDLIAITDEQGVITYASPSSQALFGCLPGEMCGRKFTEFLDEASRPWALAAFQADRGQGRRSVGLELAMKRKDGSLFTGELNGSSFQYGDRHGSLVVIRDISERKRAEVELRASEEKYRTLFDSAGDSIIIHDAQERILAANRLAAERLGYTPDEFCKLTISQVDAPGDRPHTRERISELMRKGAHTFEAVHQHKDGTLIPFDVNARRIDWGGQPAIMSVCRDIRERRKAEADLRESEETFRRMFAGIPSPAYIWMRKDDGRIVLDQYNRAAEEVTRGRIAGFLGVELEQLFAGHPELVQRIRETMHSGKPLCEEIQYTYVSTGETKWLVVDYVRTAAGRVMVITRDVSGRKEAEQKLLAYQEQLRALSSELTLVEERERRRIAADLHDQIGQNLALCKLKVAALEKRDFADEARSELSAVRRLLECSIQDARSLIFDLSPPVLYELGFQAALEWLADRIGEQYRVPVKFECQGECDALELDRQVILFQVVRELLVNIGKHAQASRAKVILSMEGGALRIKVNDDGRGFDASQAYDPKAQKGNFGFFSMRERLNYLGGAIDLRSKPGMGTQVALTVPLSADPETRRKGEEK